MSRTRKLLVAAASVALAASVAPPAAAAERTFTDKRGDVQGGFDIRSAHVDNTGKWIAVRTHHRNLRSGPDTPGGSIAVYLDTVPKRRGPEFRLAGAIGFDGEYNIVRVRGWKPVGEALNIRGQRFDVSYKRDVVRFAVRRGALARVYDHRVGKIRVAVRTAHYRAVGTGVRTDWAPRPRTLYRAVGRN